MPSISALRRQRQADLCEFKPSLVYRVPGQAPKLHRETPPPPKKRVSDESRVVVCVSSRQQML